jgi:hypothetical protein
MLRKIPSDRLDSLARIEEVETKLIVFLSQQRPLLSLDPASARYNRSNGCRQVRWLEGWITHGSLVIYLY